MKKVLFLAFLLQPFFFTPVFAKEIPMEFSNCVALIQSKSAEYGIIPIFIVNTTILVMVRFNTTDGYVLMSCSKPDQVMSLLMGND